MRRGRSPPPFILIVFYCILDITWEDNKEVRKILFLADKQSSNAFELAAGYI